MIRVGVRIGLAAALPSSTASRLLRPDPCRGVACLEAQGVEVAFHLRELPRRDLARHDRTVLERLLQPGRVPDREPLLADGVGLDPNFGVGDVLELVVRLVEALGVQPLLFLLERGQLGLDVRVDVVEDVLAFKDLGHAVVLPLVLLQQIALLHVDIVHARAAAFVFEVTFQRSPQPLAPVMVLVPRLRRGRLAFPDRFRDKDIPLAALERLGHVYPGQQVAEPAAERGGGGIVGGGASGLELLGDAIGDESVASGIADLHDALGRRARQLQHLDVAGLEDRVEKAARGRVEVLGPDEVDLVDDDEDELVREEGPDALEEADLGGDGVAAVLGQVHEVEHGGAQVGDGGDGLHLDRVHLLERVVEHAGGVDGLEAEVFVVEVADEEALGREGVRLHVHVGAGDAPEEARLADVRIAADQQRPGVGVDRGQATEMLAHLLEVEQWILEPSRDGGHAAEGGAFELLALEERLGVLDQTNIVSADGLDEMLGRRELTQGDAKMVGIVEGVEQVLVWEAEEMETSALSVPPRHLSPGGGGPARGEAERSAHGRDGCPATVGSLRGWPRASR